MDSEKLWEKNPHFKVESADSWGLIYMEDLYQAFAERFRRENEVIGPSIYDNNEGKHVPTKYKIKPIDTTT